MSDNINLENEEVLENEENAGSGIPPEEVEIIEKSEKSEEPEEKEETAELKALQDKYIRLYAEYENFRKRTAKEKDEIYSNAAADVLKNILPVLDSFERALQFSGDAQESEKVLEGLKMIETQFLSALEKIGVEEIKAEGEQFNPQLHNAVFHEQDESKPDNTVTEVLQKGYIKGDKVLRPSMVKVVN